MKLDNRIINPLEIYSPVNAMLAQVYIGQNGIFSNDSQDFENLKNAELRVLTDLELREGYTKRFCGDGFWYEYFLPLANVENKKYIPFKYLNELTDKGIKVGATIKIKNKNYPEMEQLVVVSEINYNGKDKELINITLGATGYEFETLLESYLYQAYSGHEFKPFGIEE